MCVYVCVCVSVCIYLCSYFIIYALFIAFIFKFRVSINNIIIHMGVINRDAFWIQKLALLQTAKMS